MCRMFAVRSRLPVNVTDALLGLQRLSREHGDGWGVVRFDSQDPWIETGTHAAHACRRFDAIVQSSETQSLMAHVRLASVGGVNSRNIHPFVADNVAFMHNGTVNAFETHRQTLLELTEPRWRSSIQGETDSEICFALFLTFLGEERADVHAYARAMATLVQRIRTICDGSGEDQKSALNFMVGDGNRLVATRCGRSLFTFNRQGLCFISSEELWPSEQWFEVAEDSLVTVDADFTIETTPLDSWTHGAAPSWCTVASAS